MRHAARLTLRVLHAAGLLLTLTVLLAPQASALPRICLPGPLGAPNACGVKHWWEYGIQPPGADLCKSSPAAQMPGDGLSGWIDAGPPVIDPNAASVYDRYGYPPRWHTYDLGCGGTAKHPSDELDTTVGNWLKGGGTVLVAAADSLHRFVSPPTFLSKLDPLVQQGTQAIRDALWKPYISLVLLVLGVLIIASARRQNTHHAIEAVTWCVLMLGAATFLFDYPLQASHWADAAATDTVGEVNRHMLGENPDSVDPSSVRASLLTENVLYRNWLRGELGSPDSGVAQRYGPLLLDSQAYTYTQTRIIQNDPSQAAGIAKRKSDEFNKVAQAVAVEDPNAYNNLKGSGASRIGAGAITLIAAVLTCLFMFAADVVIIVSLLLERLLIIFAPAILVLGVLVTFKRHVITAFGVAAAALINAIVFSIGAAVNALAVGVLLGSSDGLPMWLNVLLCGALTLILWGFMKPFRRLTHMVSPSSAFSSASDSLTMKGPRRAAGKLAGLAAGVGIGSRLANREPGEEQQPDEQQPAGQPASAAEQWTREPPADPSIRDVNGERVVPKASNAPRIKGVSAGSSSGEPQPEPGDVPASPRYVAAGALPAAAEPQPTGRHHADAGDQIVPAGQQLPDVIRADPAVIDGQDIYRIWDADSKTAQQITAEDKESRDGVDTA